MPRAAFVFTRVPAFQGTQGRFDLQAVVLADSLKKALEEYRALLIKDFGEGSDLKDQIKIEDVKGGLVISLDDGEAWSPLLLQIYGSPTNPSDETVKAGLKNGRVSQQNVSSRAVYLMRDRISIIFGLGRMPVSHCATCRDPITPANESLRPDECRFCLERVKD